MLLAELSGRVYVSLDIDVLDPALAPGTGTPQPGGLSYGQVLYLLEALGRNKKIVAADIVEVKPLPGSAVTQTVAARLAYKIIAYAQLYQQR